MRYPLITLMLIATTTAYAADVPTVTCHPVMVSAGAELPASIGFSDRPMGYDLGAKISYLVEGSDLIGFKDDSLTVTSITTADGKDVSKKRNGKPAWKQGSFPKATDDGKYGIFSIEISENVFGKTDGLKVVGSIVALSGSDRQTKKVVLKLSEEKTEAAGSLKLSLIGAKKTKDAGGATNGFFGGGEFGVQVVGDINQVAEITLSEGDHKLDAQGSSWSGTQRTWNFSRPTGDSVTVELSWWNKLTAVTVPIGK